MNAARDPLVLRSRADTDRDRFRFRTADGVPATEEFCPGELLALDHLWERDLGRLRVVGSRYGVVGAVLAERATAVEVTAFGARSAALCERNVAANGVDEAGPVDVELATGLESVDGPPAGRVDTAVYVPRPYTPIEIGRRRIETALRSLDPDGDLFVAATPERGLSRYESALESTAARVSAAASRDDWRLVRAERPPTVDPPRESPFDRIEATVGGIDLTLTTAPGLFAATGLDDGTRLLAETAAVGDADAVLDLCCGYAPLGAYAATAADCEVWCSDDDPLATACAERTLDANAVDATVVTADAAAGVADRTFDAVLCNPPTHAGSGVLSDLFRGAADVLAADGRLWFVRHRSLDLERHLGAFSTVETVATGAEHVVRAATPA